MSNTRLPPENILSMSIDDSPASALMLMSGIKRRARLIGFAQRRFDAPATRRDVGTPREQVDAGVGRQGRVDVGQRGVSAGNSDGETPSSAASAACLMRAEPRNVSRCSRAPASRVRA